LPETNECGKASEVQVSEVRSISSLDVRTGTRQSHPILDKLMNIINCHMIASLSTPQSYALGCVLVILATICSSLSGIFVRWVPELNGWQIACWRGYWMSVSLLIYIVFCYGSKVFEAVRTIPYMALVAVTVLFAITSTGYVTSLTLTSVANVSALGASSIIFTALLSYRVVGERVNAVGWVAVPIALIGIAVIMKDGVTSGHWIGNLLALFVALCFAGQVVSLRRYRTFDMVPAVCLGGFLIFLFAGFFGGGFDVPLHALPILALMGPIQVSLPLILFVRGTRSVPAVTLSFLVLLDVVINPLWTWIGVGEIPSLETAIGAAMIIAAVALSLLGGHWMEQRQAISTELVH
jgi:drug/metabolite transporter, DME family